jgi:hypothetical protein
MASRIAGRKTDIRDDLMQEGRIEIWRLWQRKPGQRPGYYANAARGRMRDVAFRTAKPTGAPERKARDVTDEYLMVSMEEPLDEYGTTLHDILPGSYAGPGRTDPRLAELEYEVGAVLEELEPHQREYLTERFWHNLPWGDLKAKGLIRKDSFPVETLRARLAHLKGTV